MKIAKNYIYNILLQLTSIIVPIILIPYLSRHLGPKGIGINAYVNSLSQYFVIFSSLGLNILGTREVAYAQYDREKITTVFSQIQTIKLVTVSLSILIYFLTILTNKSYMTLMIFNFPLIFSVFFDISWLFIGLENFKKVTIRTILTKLISAILIIMFVKSEKDLWIYVLIMSFSQLIGNWVYWINLKKFIIYKKLKFCFSKFTIKESVFLMLPQLATLIPGIITRTVLTKMTSVTDVGFYDNADKVISILLTLTTSLSTVMMPAVAAEFKKNNKSSIQDLMNISLNFIIFLSIGIIFGLITISNEFSLLFFGKEFLGISLVIQTLAVNILLISLNQVIGRQYLISTNKTNLYNYSILINLTLLILFLPFSINIYGIFGAIVSIVIANLISLVFLLSLTVKEGLYVKIPKNFFKCFISGIGMYLIVTRLNFNYLNDWVSLLINCLIGFIVYVLLNTIVKHRIMVIIIEKFKAKKRI